MTSCVSEPISFLKLERYRLGELPARDARAVDEHLAQCAGCRACFEEIERDSAELVLPPLPMHAQPRVPAANVVRLPQRPARRLLLAASAVVSIAAALVLVLRPSPSALDTPPSRIRVKGGDLAVELVRKTASGISGDSARYAAGDAFKVLLTCPPAAHVQHVDVVVYQGGEAFFPLAAVELQACGNRRTLDGAFSLDGAGEARVCVALSDGALSRSALGRGPSELPETSVCAAVLPVQ